MKTEGCLWTEAAIPHCMAIYSNKIFQTILKTFQRSPPVIMEIKLLLCIGDVANWNYECFVGNRVEIFEVWTVCITPLCDGYSVTDHMPQLQPMVAMFESQCLTQSFTSISKAMIPGDKSLAYLINFPGHGWASISAPHRFRAVPCSSKSVF